MGLVRPRIKTLTMRNKTNAELIELITKAAKELERRRVKNELPASATEDEGSGDVDEGEGGDHPPDPKFP